MPLPGVVRAIACFDAPAPSAIIAGEELLAVIRWNWDDRYARLSFVGRAAQCGRDMESISTDLAGELGITTSHSKMDNGELRYRLVAQDGSSYIRTEASADGGWQNSHYHKSVSETYIVQNKWIAFAERDGNDMRLWIMHAGDIYTTRIGVSHNAYLPPRAVLHTVKHGDSGEGGDRFEDPVLDSLTQHLSEADILARAAMEAQGARTLR